MGKNIHLSMESRTAEERSGLGFGFYLSQSYQRERKSHKTYFIGNEKINRIESSETFSK